MAAPLTTVISSIPTNLPTCEPNLMPFHIGYSGPASVSAFMRVEKFTSQNSIETGSKKTTPSGQTSEPTRLEGPVSEAMAENTSSTEPDTPGTSNNIAARVDSTENLIPATETDSQAISNSTTAVESQTSLSSNTTRVSLAAPIPDDADKRVISSFRGRTIHGLSIGLPPGYSGLILRGEGSNTNRENQEDAKDTKARSKAQGTSHKLSTSGEKRTPVAEQPAAKPRGRLTRSAVSKPVVIAIEDEDEEMTDAIHEPCSNGITEQNDDPEDNVETSDDLLIRKLIPQAQFSSFTLWHADRPVDKGSDEYYRSLTEWIALSREIHRTDL